tara:strand:- start:252 stop:1124 length:873 start_codon:yes stop_codon:yes gene_type:complete
MIFVSTGGFANSDAATTVKKLSETGINSFELSGGKYKEHLYEELREMRESFFLQVHNYFPPPKEPFVLNLASLDNDNAVKSIKHVKKAIEWANDIGQSIYSFHSGFLLDPKVSELGKKVQTRELFDRHDSLSYFIERVNDLDKFAKNHGVKLLIENNVLSANNYERFSSDPFLMTNSEECIKVMKSTSDNVELLIDVAHLKVSSNSLGFNPVKFLKDCENWIRAYHLSDNDGATDSNDPISKRSWFLPHLKTDLEYYSLEIYGISNDKIIEQYNLLESYLNNNRKNELDR